MKCIPRWLTCSALRWALLPLALLIPGCGHKNDQSPAEISPPNQASPSYAASVLATNPVQAEINKLAPYPHEHDVASRPLILSERQGNKRDWCLRTLEKGYHDTGRTNPAWDQAVHDAFAGYADYTRVTNDWSNYGAMTNGVRRALAAHCDDPMIEYMNARYLMEVSGSSPEQTAIALLRAHRELLPSHYHPAFKFIAGYRAVKAAQATDPDGNRTPVLGFVTFSLEDLARDTNAPAAEVIEPVDLWMTHANNKDWVPYVMRNVEPILDQNWSQEPDYQRLKGAIEIGRAWNARGTGFANTVTEEGQRGFQQHLDIAETLLTSAWQSNPSNAYTALLMMKLELGQGRGRLRMELWFHRAMALAPAYYDAAQLMSFYLEPRWYGSEERCLEFSRECVRNTNWFGEVPLVLANTHGSLAAWYHLAESPDYWQRPQVWPDIQASYERFFQLNPYAVGYRHNYARDAYLCGHYAEFLAQVKFFNNTNFAYFGGPEKFRQMLTNATAAAAKNR